MIMLCVVLHIQVFAQQPLQVIRGEIRDQTTQMPIPGAVVSLHPSSPTMGTTSAADGRFRLSGVPIGRYEIRVQMLGYQELRMPNVVLGAGKEVVLTLSMVEHAVEMDAVEIHAETENKAQSNNEIATVSARQFSVEETKRYAGALNDPGRMAQSFAGVTVNGDGSNEIVVRGNSPRGMLWRMEGIEIPNPNHFANQGAAGGAISMLSNSMMANSDFYTGAFPADYGNAASGVFDIRLRRGNNEKREVALQAGVIGTDVALEGPFKKNYAGSYLFNYRYSSLALLQKMGINIVGDAIPVFQDLCFNIQLPTEKAGNFSMFGIGGLSRINQEYAGKTRIWKDRFRTQLGVIGVTHSYLFNDKTWLRTVVAGTGTTNRYTSQELDTAGLYRNTPVDEDFKNTALRISSTLNHKINRKNSLRTGAIYSHLGYAMQSEVFNTITGSYQTALDQLGQTGFFQGFFNWQHRINDQLTLNAGLHYSRFLLNNAQSVEPRMGMKWNFRGTQILSLGLGQHSRLEDLPMYFFREPLSATEDNRPNLRLGFSKAQHIVMGYETMVLKQLHLKSELYYQHLFNVPVEAHQASAKSAINMGQGFANYAAVNAGLGKNYGAELSVEKFFGNQFYFLLTGSVFQSRYRGSDGVWRNTAYNSGYAGSVLGGKEFAIGKRHVLSMNVRWVYSGGKKYTPVLLEASQNAGYGIYDETHAYSATAMPYRRFDLGISYTIHRSTSTRVWKLDIQNVGNRLNEFGRYYNTDTAAEEVATMAGMIPTLSYRIEF